MTGNFLDPLLGYIKIDLFSLGSGTAQSCTPQTSHVSTLTLEECLRDIYMQKHLFIQLEQVKFTAEPLLVDLRLIY